MYNVTLGLFVQPLLSWKSDKYYLWACVCSLRYPVCSAHATRNVNLWPVWLCSIFPHLINCTIFKKKLLNIECVFWFCLQLLS